ncbi:MAG TPA: hypothetical protein VFJ58_16615 [Armatimonadota bacterium]|nr:hypothetical protein [Armatimonadota bacterium]
MEDKSTPDEERALDQFMEGNVRADRLTELCDALAFRIRALKSDLARDPAPAERKDLEKRLSEARRQLSVLQQEQAISQFVEDSVRVTLRDETLPSAEPSEFDDEEGE